MQSAQSRLQHLPLIILIVSLPALLTTTSANAEDIWTRDVGNPIFIESGDPDKFDTDYVSAPRVVYDYDTDTYFMYYTGGVTPLGPCREMIGLATAPSLDGSWTRYDASGYKGSIFEAGEPGDYDYNRNWGIGTIIKEGENSWKMWTVGDSLLGGIHVGRVGYATSTNGYDWTKYEGEGYGGAIFEDMGGVTHGARGIMGFAMLKENDIYHAWYGLFHRPDIKYATSPDGINWTAQQTVLSGVWSVGNVVKIGQTYYLGTSKPDLTGGLFYTSTDRVNWTRCDEIQVSPTEMGWDSETTYHPFLFPASEDEWHLFYAARILPQNGRIGHAYATVPEPSTLAMLAGLAGLGLLVRRKRPKRPM